MDIILVPGLWLDGSSWDKVVPVLEAAGHRTHAMTLPGLESREADRSKITLEDHVDAVVRVIDACATSGNDQNDQKVVLVGHSAACGLCSVVLDARADRVARAIYVGGFPAVDGDQLAASFPAENGDVPLPDFSVFGEEDMRDLDDDARRAFRERAVPSPERVCRDTVRLSDERRYDVPVTAICPEYTADQLRTWIADGEEPVQEFTRIRDVEYVDVPTGHWPQFTRPDELARAILDAVR